MQSPFDKDKIDKIKTFLTAGCETISVAESVTAGLLQLAIASAEDASLFFQGGITAYNLGQKSRHLLIEPIHALSCNCVSGKVAGEMALNVCRLFSSDWGVGVTGYATPVPESDNKIFCYYAVSYHGKIIMDDKIVPREGSPYEIQIAYTGQLLDALLGKMQKMSLK